MMITDSNEVDKVAFTPHNLALQLKTALQATLFGSRLLTPRRLAQIADESASSFARYVDSVEADIEACAFGRRLAREGLGHPSILALVGTLHTYAWELWSAQGACPPPSFGYAGSLLSGYMAEREEYLLKEQEVSRLALERARSQESA